MYFLKITYHLKFVRQPDLTKNSNEVVKGSGILWPLTSDRTQKVLTSQKNSPSYGYHYDYHWGT